MNNDDFSPENISKTAFFTGHRYLREEQKDLISSALFRCLKEAYDAGYRRFFCGCALGFDTLAAFQTVRLREIHPDVILSLAIPCKSQPDRWSEKDKTVYHRILEIADEKTVLSPFYYQGAMLTRNRFMADRSSLCICYLTHARGGTASTVRYALVHDGIRVVNLAVSDNNETGLLRENKWNCMFISPSALKNADTVPLRLMQQRKMNMRHI